MGMSKGPKPTKLEAEWMDAVKNHGCLQCLDLGYAHIPYESPMVEANHLLSGGIRVGHLWTVGSCMWHHRGRLIVNNADHAWHRRMLGPALSEGSHPFHARWGSDLQLMDQQRKLFLSRGLHSLVDRVTQEISYG